MHWMIKLLISILLNYVQICWCHNDCPTLESADRLSQTQLLDRLTHGCRYDRLERPLIYSESGERLPIDVYVRAYIYFMQNLEAHDLQFKIFTLLQFRYVDPRLAFSHVAPKRKQPILGEKQLRDTLWMPHIFLANERDSSILGTNEKDILTSISPDGMVIVSSRIKATLYCWLNLKKFPFDEQHCNTVLESWMYNTSELVLHWEQKRPITYDPALHLTEYVLKNSWSNETIINADLSDLRHGAFAGNYSSLSFTVHLTRVAGFYLMDYFLPSMLIVGISWVSFWLQADQAPPRITLGTATMLTFITLASAQGKTLPKVSYIKVSEVWFLGCTIFIFGSLLEFAFVNSIWRRKYNVPIKKLNSREILKSTLSPRQTRRLSKMRSSSFSGGLSCGRFPDPALFGDNTNINNYLTVNLPITTIREGLPLDPPKRKLSWQQQLVGSKRKFDISKVESADVIPLTPSRQQQQKQQQQQQQPLLAPPEIKRMNSMDSLGTISHEEEIANNGWTTLTPQEIAMWIDRKARVFFPISFLIFNVFYWTFVYFI